MDSLTRATIGVLLDVLRWLLDSLRWGVAADPIEDDDDENVPEWSGRAP